MIVLEHVSKTFTSHGQSVPAVDDVSLEVGEGELHVLIGPSGSGNTSRTAPGTRGRSGASRRERMTWHAS